MESLGRGSDDKKLFEVGALVGILYVGQISLWETPPFYPHYEDFPVDKLEGPCFGVILELSTEYCKVYIDEKMGWVNKSDLITV